jgi:hypothetical protein
MPGMFAGALESFASKIADMSNAYVYQGASLSNQKRAMPFQMSNYETYFDFLESYHFLDVLLNILSSTVSEAINSTDFKISIEGDDSGEMENCVEDFFKKVHLKETILSDVRSFIYRGKYFYAIDYKNEVLRRVTNPYEVKIIERRGDPCGYLFGKKFIDNLKGASYYYTKDNLEQISRDRVVQEGIKAPKDDLIDKSELGKYIVDYSIFEGKSLFRSQLLRIYQLYVIEYSLYYLSLRESVRPDIIAMNIVANKKNIGQAANSANRIESMLNVPNSLVGNVVDPMAFINELTFTLMNNIKIVPNVDSYSQMSPIDIPDSVNKRDRLQQEYESIQRQILNNLGIPEEIYGGTSNRWEVMSRSDRYMTLNKDILSSIVRFIKQIAINKIESKFNKKLDLSQLNFNIEINNFMANYANKAKLAAANERLMDIDRIIQDYSGMMNPESGLDKNNVKEFYRKLLLGSDPTVIPLLGLDQDKADRRGLHPKDANDRFNDDGAFPNTSANMERRGLNPLVNQDRFTQDGAIRNDLNPETPEYRRSIHPVLNQNRFDNGVIKDDNQIAIESQPPVERRDLHPIIKDSENQLTDTGGIIDPNLRRDINIKINQSSLDKDGGIIT